MGFELVAEFALSSSFGMKELKAIEQVDQTLCLLKQRLGSNLLGVYIYGSSEWGGLQRYSDVDIFVIVDRPLTLEDRSSLNQNLLQLSGIYCINGKLPIELTIVVKNQISPWHYPPRCDFQYGEWMREIVEGNVAAANASSEMPDLAVIITQLLLKSRTLFGSQPKELLPEVPYSDFIKAMISGVEELKKALKADTRNVLLTFARIWSTLKTNQIRSKQSAAKWAINELSEVYRPVLIRAMHASTGVEDEHWDDLEELLEPCIDEMEREINKAASSINHKNLSIKIELEK